MDLMEYKARELFERYDIPVPRGAVADSAAAALQACGDLAYPLVVKAQVQVGGRGKAGGVRFAQDAQELQQHAESILGMDIKGHIVKKLLIVEKVDIAKELYLSMMLDRLTKCPIIIFSAQGGMDIEQVARETPDQVLKLAVDPLMGINAFQARYLVDKSGLDSALVQPLLAVLRKLYKMFLSCDCMLAEINPLVIDGAGNLIAADGKVSVDDSALYRQPDILAFRDELTEDARVKEARSFNFLYVPCEPDGKVAVMSNGSGMIMSCMDLIAKEGVKTGVAFDLGGGATAERIAEAIRIVLQNPAIKLLFITIFGGITRCDEVAGGVKRALETAAGDTRVIIRFEGTNKDKGLQILSTIEPGRVIFAASILEGVAKLAGMKEDLV